MYFDDYAAGTHFGRIIAPGVMSFMSVWSEYLKQDIVGSELIAGKSTKIQWHKPVFADDILTGKAVVTGLTARNEQNGTVEITIKNLQPARRTGNDQRYRSCRQTQKGLNRKPVKGTNYGKYY